VERADLDPLSRQEPEAHLAPTLLHVVGQRVRRTRPPELLLPPTWLLGPAPPAFDLLEETQPYLSSATNLVLEVGRVLASPVDLSLEICESFAGPLDLPLSVLRVLAGDGDFRLEVGYALSRLGQLGFELLDSNHFASRSPGAFGHHGGSIAQR
jgi:hypothetical protein